MWMKGHNVTFLGDLQITHRWDANMNPLPSMYTFKVQSWGKVFTVNTTADVFQKNYKGFTYGTDGVE